MESVRPESSRFRSLPIPCRYIEISPIHPIHNPCFGDYDHPTVVVLRRFRDFTLMTDRWGRAFVGFYYRRGPRLARFVERVPMLKPPIRLALALFTGI
jgi:hypothetical protein